jgi:hypothetical protein
MTHKGMWGKNMKKGKEKKKRKMRKRKEKKKRRKKKEKGRIRLFFFPGWCRGHQFEGSTNKKG